MLTAFKADGTRSASSSTRACSSISFRRRRFCMRALANAGPLPFPLAVARALRLLVQPISLGVAASPLCRAAPVSASLPQAAACGVSNLGASAAPLIPSRGDSYALLDSSFDISVSVFISVCILLL